MEGSTRKTHLTDSEIQAIINDAESRALSNWLGVIVRAGLGTLFFVLAVYVVGNPRTTGLILLCGLFILGLGIYIGSVTRSFPAGPHAVARGLRPRSPNDDHIHSACEVVGDPADPLTLKDAGVFEPLGRVTVCDADKHKKAKGVASDKRSTL